MVDYGKRTSPILPLSIECVSGDNKLSECSRTELNISQCSRVVGVDCIGTFYLSFTYRRAESLCVFVLQLLVLLKTKPTVISKTEDITFIFIFYFFIGGLTAAVTLTAFQMVTVALISHLQRTASVT